MDRFELSFSLDMEPGVGVITSSILLKSLLHGHHAMSEIPVVRVCSRSLLEHRLVMLSAISLAVGVISQRIIYAVRHLTGLP